MLRWTRHIMAGNSGSYDEMASKRYMAHYGGKQLKSMKEARYFGRIKVEVVTDAAHYGRKY